MSEEVPMRRCTDCKEHSGMVERLNSGTDIMTELKESIEKLRENFDAHVEKQAKKDHKVLLLLIACLLTGFMSLGVSTFKSAQKHVVLSQETEKNMLLREIVEIMKERR